MGFLARSYLLRSLTQEPWLYPSAQRSLSCCLIHVAFSFPHDHFAHPFSACAVRLLKHIGNKLRWKPIRMSGRPIQAPSGIKQKVYESEYSVIGRHLDSSFRNVIFDKSTIE